jgi:hypothetical protein
MTRDQDQSAPRAHATVYRLEAAPQKAASAAAQNCTRARLPL